MVTLHIGEHEVVIDHAPRLGEHVSVIVDTGEVAEGTVEALEGTVYRVVHYFDSRAKPPEKFCTTVYAEMD